MTLKDFVFIGFGLLAGFVLFGGGLFRGESRGTTTADTLVYIDTLRPLNPKPIFIFRDRPAPVAEIRVNIAVMDTIKVEGAPVMVGEWLNKRRQYKEVFKGVDYEAEVNTTVWGTMEGQSLTFTDYRPTIVRTERIRDKPKNRHFTGIYLGVTAGQSLGAGALAGWDRMLYGVNYDVLDRRVNVGIYRKVF